MTPDGANVVFQSAFGKATDNLVSNDTHGDIQVFETNVTGAAGVTTEAATAITSSGATLNGSVNPEGSATTVTFVYGTSPSLSGGTTTTSPQSIGAGTTAVSVSQALTGLTAGTTYYFEVKATNGIGTTTGSILSFVATAVSTPPVVATEAATAITTSGATLNASVNPEGSATTVTFVYGTTPGLTGATTKTTTQSIGAGKTAVAVSAALTGLAAGTTYYFEVKATNGIGTTTGSILSFVATATSTPPVATTQPATAITTNSATLLASVNPEGSATTVMFVYGTTPALTGATTMTSAQSIGAGKTAVAVSAALTGLTAGTTYYFKVTATNGIGTTTGSILSFVATATSTPPVATTKAATAITTTTATLLASVNPEGSATTVSFVYGTSPSLTGATTTSPQSIGAGTTSVGVSAALTGLTVGKTYYFEVKATNGGGTSTGSILGFATTGGITPPVATTESAITITTTTATLVAIVNPAGHATTVTFVYGTTPSLSGGTTTTATQSIGAGTTTVAVLANLTDLTAGTTYYFEVKATNPGGMTTGSILGFSTAANPALIAFSTGQFAANVTDGSAQVEVTRAGNPAATDTVVLSSPGGQGVAPFMTTVTFGPATSVETVSIPIQNDGVPGLGDAIIPFSLSSASSGATLGSAAASLVIHDTNPFPTPITVTSVSTPRIAVKVGKGKKAKTQKETVLQVTFSGNVASGVLNSGAYHVMSGTTRKAVTTYNKKVALSSFSYNPSTYTLTIVPTTSLNLNVPEELVVTSSLLTDAYGRPLDGNSDGQPGGNIVATFSKKGVKVLSS